MKKQLSILSGIVAFMVLVAFTPISESEGYFSIDGKASSVKWVASKITGGTHEGTISISEGGLQVENGKIVGGKFTIDMKTINVTDLDGGMKTKLEGHLNSDDFFATEKFRTANLAIISSDGSKVKANLTIKGITQEITFPVVVKVEGGQLTATANIEIDRSKFDVRYGSDSFFDNLGDKAINNEIKFTVILKGKAA